MTQLGGTNADTMVWFALVMILGLISGGLLHYVVEHKLEGAVPYTVTVFVAGGVVGLSLFFTQQAGTPARTFLDQSNYLSSVILYLLLPVLIFSEAMSLNWHRSMRALNQSLWLAGPGVVLGCLLTGLAAEYFMHWSFNAGCVFGAILSATDPVAVVSLLKSAGAPGDLTMIIVGESLLNDGSAIFMYQLFVDLSSKSSVSPAGIVEFFLSNAVGSVAFGAAIGMVTNSLMRFLDNPLKKLDMALQTAITLCVCYVSFVVPQKLLDISGVLSASAAGLVIARFAPPFILHHRAMHRVWGCLEWVCNTLIFYLAGLAAADRGVKYFVLADIYTALAWYVFTMVLRAIMILVLYPILRRGTLPIDLTQCVFLNWAGLRGALAVALVLQLESSGIFSAQVSRKIFIQVIGVVALTLLINGTTAKYLLEWLHLSEKFVEDEDIVMLLKNLVRRNMTKVVDVMLLEDGYGVSAETLAEKYCSFLQTSSDFKARDTFSLKRDMKQKGKAKRQSVLALNGGATDGATTGLGLGLGLSSSQSSSRLNALAASSPDPVQTSSPAPVPAPAPAPTPVRTVSPRRSSAASRLSPSLPGSPESDKTDGGCDPYLMSFLRRRFYDSLHVTYTNFVDIGKIPRSSNSAHVLLFSLDAALEQTDEPICDWRFTVNQMEGAWPPLWIVKAVDDLCKKCTGKRPGLYSWRVSAIEKRIIYIVSNLIDAHLAVQKKIPTFLGAEGSVAVGAGGVAGAPGGGPILDVLIEEAEIKAESEAVVREAREYLSNRFSEMGLQDFWEQSAARVILHQQREVIRRMIADRMISKTAAADMLSQIRADGMALERKRIEMHREFIRVRKNEQEGVLKRVDTAATMSPSQRRTSGGKMRDDIPNPVIQREPFADTRDPGDQL